MKNDRSLFAPAPRRKRGLILTLSGSLLFHGSLVGVAAFWPTHPVVKQPIITEVGFEPGISADLPLPPDAPPSETQPEAPVLKAVEPVEDQPPTVEPNPDDMMLATPRPRPAARAAQPHTVPVPPTNRTTRVPGSLSTSGPASAATGSGPGAGRPGVRWNVPKPVYPPSLRLAHVQGNGSVRVTTDDSGRVTSAVIVQSTGSVVLDDQTCETAKLRWSGPPNATTTVPITYQLQ